MSNWILLTILYSFFTALFESAKKKAVEKNSIYTVLTIFTTMSFFLIFLTTKDAFNINYNYVPIILIKSTIIVIAWILGLKAIEQMQISIYGIVKISRIIFSVILSCFILGETITIIGIIGMFIAIIGLVLVNCTANNNNSKKPNTKVVLMLLLSCFLNSVSAIIDKKILLYISCSQLQFWFLLFLTIYYWLIFIIKKEKINIKKTCNNYWIIIASLCLVLGDRALFIANKDTNSQVVIMTMLKQISVIITILLGKIMFKEKETLKKLLYSILILFGILIMIIF